MQPVQDLTIDDTVSRTQYQFILQDADPANLPNGAQAGRETAPGSATRRRRERHLGTGSIGLRRIDRDTAARFGITPATIDNALYDAFGQRIVSTIYTQSNQYRVILEADPTLQASLQSLRIYLPSSVGGGRCRCR